MKAKIDLAKALMQKQKYNKALSIIKKINVKKALATYETLEIEATCLFYEKKYQLAIIKLNKALELTPNSESKANILSNLSSISEKLGEVKDAINYQKASLAIDGSLNVANRRFSLIQIAFSVQDFDTVLEYGPVLKNVSMYANSALLLLAQSAIQKKTTRFQH